MGDVADQMNDSSSIKLTASPFSNIGKQDAMNSSVDVPATAYRIYNSSHIPSPQFSSIGNSIIKPGIPKLSAHEVSEDAGICPVILHPTKQLSSQVMKSDLVKTIGFSSGRSPMTSQHPSRIVATSIHHSIMESQNVSPLIITPKPHVIHTNNDVVSSKAKIVPIPSTPLSSHFSVINKSSVPEYTGVPRHDMISSSVSSFYPPSDFARFSNKNNLKSGVLLNPAVIHGPISSGLMEDTGGLTIPNSQHLFKPITSPRPSILRKRDADGVLKAQKNLIPLLNKPDLEESQNANPLNRNGYSESGLQLDSIMVPQNPEVVLPQISTLSQQSHIMVEISPRKKPRKQLLPANQESSFKMIGDEIMCIDEKCPKNDKISEEFPDEDVVDCNDDCRDGDIEEEEEEEDDEFDDDLDDNCPNDDGYDDENEDEEDEDDFGDGCDYKSEKPFYEEAKAPTDLSDDNFLLKSKNKRPTLLGGVKNLWRGRSHHFQKYSDFKIKETKKQLAEIQQTKKWLSDSKTGWRIRYLLKQFVDMAKNEDEIIDHLIELTKSFEKTVQDSRKRHIVIELIKDNIQRSKVTKGQIEEVNDQLSKVFDNTPLIEDVIDKYCPKELKKKNMKVFNKLFN